MDFQGDSFKIGLRDDPLLQAFPSRFSDAGIAGEIDTRLDGRRRSGRDDITARIFRTSRHRRARRIENVGRIMTLLAELLHCYRRYCRC